MSFRHDMIRVLGARQTTDRTLIPVFRLPRGSVRLRFIMLCMLVLHNLQHAYRIPFMAIFRSHGHQHGPTATRQIYYCHL